MAKRLKNRVLAQTEMAHIPAGRFLQGRKVKPREVKYHDDAPQRLVQLSSYHVDKYEVSVKQFKACIEAGSCAAKGIDLEKVEGDEQPAHYVTWYAAERYCKWLGKRLPTEAEWERAARGDKGRAYPWKEKNLRCKLANVGLALHPHRGLGYVCEHGPTPVTWFEHDGSPYGLSQMGGNVAEWVQDWYRPDYYKKAPKKDPRGPKKGESAYRTHGGKVVQDAGVKTVRGGCYFCSDYTTHVTYRWYATPSRRDHRIGFRCASSREVPRPAPPAKEAPPRRKGTHDMVLVPAGSFLRGSVALEVKPPASGQYSSAVPTRHGQDELPQRSIHLDAYYIDRYEVSVAQYKACYEAKACGHALWQDPGSKFNVAKNPYSNFKSYVRPNQPVNGVSWLNARDYCKWRGKRLPTEAEWEKAMRGAKGAQLPEHGLCGNIGHFAKVTRLYGRPGEYRSFSYSTTIPVRWYQRCKSPYGAVQMLGNVQEWVSDWYGWNYYKKSPDKNPTGPAEGTMRVKRGSCWICPLKYATTTWRDKARPEAQDGMTGIRCALSASVAGKGEGSPR